MACCGPSIKRRDEKSLFEELRNNEEEISLKLNSINMNFLPDKGFWKSN
jgi:hypothetical protein